MIRPHFSSVIPTNCVHSATDDFNHGVVLSNRPLRSNEVFQVRIDKMVDKWAGSIEIGVTTHNPAYLQLPSTMTNLRSGEVGEALTQSRFEVCWRATGEDDNRGLETEEGGMGTAATR